MNLLTDLRFEIRKSFCVEIKASMPSYMKNVFVFSFFPDTNFCLSCMKTPSCFLLFSQREATFVNSSLLSWIMQSFQNRISS